MGTHPIVQGFLGLFTVTQGFEGNTTPSGGGTASTPIVVTYSPVAG